MKKKKALIFGVTGQDGAYLSRFLLKKKYIVHGVKRRSSLINTARIDKIYEDKNKKKKNFILHYGDVLDSLFINEIIKKVSPDEIYNLSAQSHVAVSFEIPEYTSDVNALGVLRILEAIKNFADVKKIKFYQAGTSEMYGKVQSVPQNEKTSFYPRSPYGVSKLFAHWITTNYRESYSIFACNGILFNHESPIRGETFVTKKIVDGLVKIKNGTINKIFLGNIYSKRDWGHAEDYVEAMWLMLKQKKPQDFVIATGQQYSVKKFIELVAAKLKMKVHWVGKGLKEKLIYQTKPIIEIKKEYFRPSEVETLVGDYSKARKVLKWKPKKTIHHLIDDMIKNNFDK